MGWMAPLRHLGAKMLTGRRPAANGEPSMGEPTTIGLDLAKHVFPDGTPVLRKQLRHGQVLVFFSKLHACRRSSPANGVDALMARMPDSGSMSS